MQPETALARLGGAARRIDVINAGVGPKVLRAARESGRVVVPVRGTYALPLASRETVAVAALRGQLCCVSACSTWGIRQLTEPKFPHIAVPPNRHLRPDRLAKLNIPDVHRGVAFVANTRTLPVREALDTAALCTTPLEQLVMVDAALESGLLEYPELAFFRCGTDARRKWLARTANGRAMSVSESVARVVLGAGGLRPRVQVSRAGVGALDLAVGTRHFVEIDGFKDHSKYPQFKKDRLRDREVSAARDWTLRYTYWDVVEDPRWFVRDVARIVRQPVHLRFEARMAWLTAAPQTTLNPISSQTRAHSGSYAA